VQYFGAVESQLARFRKAHPRDEPRDLSRCGDRPSSTSRRRRSRSGSLARPEPRRKSMRSNRCRRGRAS
jgi:hypothetical protein